MKSLVVRFSEQVSKHETTHQRLKDIAEFLGVSQNKAVAYAINKAWEYLAEHEDMLETLELKRYGTEVGGITYLNADPAFIERVRERITKGIPLPHEDDDSIENDLLFMFLSKEHQDAIRATADPMEKRRLKAKFLKETSPESAAENMAGQSS
ncbi:MAG: hypothetical protein DI596_14300 [Azospira oryzae]|nr:MAG: hypothetical protein DI596_14300 [Azospira oryzae]PZP76160.1 MAG: hypothetical protein DI593_14300 [Azospira oryzae]